MLKLDNTLLEEIGLGSLPDAQKRQMLQHIYDTLELRVGTHLANQMTDKQLEEFEKFIDAGGDANQAQALQWLEANLPNYKQVVQDTFEALKAEVKQMAPQLLAAAAAQPQEAQIMPQPMTPPQGVPLQPSAQPSYSPPALQPSQQFGVPASGQVVPSQQAPADSSQALQQPSAYAQQPPSAFSQTSVPGAGGFTQPSQPPVGQSFATQGAVSQSSPVQSDPFAAPSTPQPTAPQFGQPGQYQDNPAQSGPVAGPPMSSPWQPPTSPVNPTDSAWQPRPTVGQEPPQGAV